MYSTITLYWFKMSSLWWFYIIFSQWRNLFLWASLKLQSFQTSDAKKNSLKIYIEKKYFTSHVWNSVCFLPFMYNNGSVLWKVWRIWYTLWCLLSPFDQSDCSILFQEVNYLFGHRILMMVTETVISIKHTHKLAS